MPTAISLPPETALGVLDDPIEQDRFTRWTQGPRGERLAQSFLQLSGLHCAACAGIIEQALLGVEGVRSAQVSAATERATVGWNPAETGAAALIEAVRRAGYTAVPDAAAPARAMRLHAQRQALWRLFVAGFCAMQVMTMAAPGYFAKGDELAPDLRQLLNVGSWLLTIPVLLFSAAPFFTGAWQALRQRRVGMDLPVALGVAIMFVASTAATFDPAGIFGHEVYFDSLTMFITFLLGARYLEQRARHAAADALEASAARLPETAWRLDAQGVAEAVSVHRLRPGDRIRVVLGQAFAADGTIEQGTTQADESLLSGESHPVPKATGATVVAGSLNVGAPVVMRVDRVGSDTQLEAIVSMMRNAMSQRPESARLADRWAAPFLGLVLILAAAAAAVWSVIDPSRAVWVAVSVLIVTCPCALSLAAPATLVAAARGLARRGVLLQRLDALESLAGAQQFFFDKTGTLTDDKLFLGAIHLTAAGQAIFGNEGAAKLRAASLAAWSTHPLARALVEAAPAQTPSGIWSEVDERPGQGMSARDDSGRLWRLGSAQWLGAEADFDAQLWLDCDGQCLAAFRLDEALRPGVTEALQALQADGLHVTVLTGDTPSRALSLASRIGVADVLAGASPAAKLAAVAAAQAQGRLVCMVGDGINDAPVLARANISLAMGQGALISRSQADAVITSNRLADLVDAQAAARRAVRIVRQNLVWAAGYNALCIPLALAGWLPPWAAGLGMATSSLVVVLNSLRAAR